MKTKYCPKCNCFKKIKEFGKSSFSKDNLQSYCKKCIKDYGKERYQKKKENILKQMKEKYQKDKNKILKQAKKYRDNNKDTIKDYREKNKEKISKQGKEYRKNFPWKRTFQHIKQRCNNFKSPDYERYGGRGIKSLITEEQLKELWFRDKAYLMERPSIDRKDNDADYTFENCRYIELKHNTLRATRKSIFQYDLEGNFIREWKSITKASEELKINKGNIGSCLKGRYKSAGGFKWKLKQNLKGKKMKKQLPAYCERCGSFIGNLGNLTDCPTCGMEFGEIEAVEPKEDDE